MAAYVGGAWQRVIEKGSIFSLPSLYSAILRILSWEQALLKRRVGLLVGLLRIVVSILRAMGCWVGQ